MIDTHTEDGQAGDGGTAADSPDATRMGGALVQRGMVADQGSPQPFPHMDGNTCILLVRC